MAIHVGLITRCEVPYTLDLANQLCEAGLSVTLYLCREHTIAEVGDSENPLESLYKLAQPSFAFCFSQSCQDHP